MDKEESTIVISKVIKYSEWRCKKSAAGRWKRRGVVWVRANLSRGTGILSEPHSLIPSTIGSTITTYPILLSDPLCPWSSIFQIGTGWFYLVGVSWRGGGGGAEVVWVEMVLGGESWRYQIFRQMN